MSQYIDDSSIIHTNDIEEANATHEKIKSILQDHGFVLNLDKECSYISTWQLKVKGTCIGYIMLSRWQSQITRSPWVFVVIEKF